MPLRKGYNPPYRVFLSGSSPASLPYEGLAGRPTEPLGCGAVPIPSSLGYSSGCRRKGPGHVWDGVRLQRGGRMPPRVTTRNAPGEVGHPSQPSWGRTGAARGLDGLSKAWCMRCLLWRLVPQGVR